MTNPTDNTLESLLASYEAGVTNTEPDSHLDWLEARSTLETRWDELTPEQVKRVEDADGTLVQDAGRVPSRLAAANAASLAERRAATPRPPEHWWWYLDALAQVSDYYGEGAVPAPNPRAQFFSRLLVVFEVALLGVMLFFLGRNLGIIPTPAAPTSTPFPTSTPAPTETLNAAAFDLSKATIYKAPFGVIEIQLPTGWQTPPAQQPNTYIFAYGETGNESLSVGVMIGKPETLYENVLRLTASVASPKDALAEFKKGIPAESTVKVSDVIATKVGKLDAQGLTWSIPADVAQGSPDSEVELRIATLTDGQIALVLLRGRTSVWNAAKTTVDKMIESLVINPQNIPTATPTATLHPLLITATALQKEIDALTPSPTPTPVATGAATAAATAAATGAATPAATPESTASR